MDNRTTLMYGALLHDIGKIITRSNEGAASHQTAGKQFLQQLPPFNDEQFLQLVAYHDLEQIEKSKLSNKYPFLFASSSKRYCPWDRSQALSR
ncbi:MAG TPA: HD domain-containing protein [Pseudogracilibacillus sp.]|nr:HD domain-containing protein [Pseudogracilibacillus sp.]